MVMLLMLYRVVLGIVTDFSITQIHDGHYRRYLINSVTRANNTEFSATDRYSSPANQIREPFHLRA